MQNTVLIEQTAKNIKLAEAIVLTVLFCCIRSRAGRDVSLPGAGPRHVHSRRDRAHRLHGSSSLALVDARVKNHIYIMV